jgi:hypothetical protein
MHKVCLKILETLVTFFIWFCWLLDLCGKFGFRFGDWTYDFVLLS